MSIQAKMKKYTVLSKTASQNAYGETVSEWSAVGNVTGAFHAGMPSQLNTQNVDHREHESYILTLQRPAITAGTNRLIINGHHYDVLHVGESDGRYLKIVVKSIMEGLP